MTETAKTPAEPAAAEKPNFVFIVVREHRTKSDNPVAGFHVSPGLKTILKDAGVDLVMLAIEEQAGDTCRQVSAQSLDFLNYQEISALAEGLSWEPKDGSPLVKTDLHPMLKAAERAKKFKVGKPKDGPVKSTTTHTKNIALVD